MNPHRFIGIATQLAIFLRNRLGVRTYNWINPSIWLVCAYFGITAIVSYAQSSNKLWTSTSDWFRPAPERSLDNILAEARSAQPGDFDGDIPKELIYAVPSRFRHRAARLLGASDIILLSGRERWALSGEIDRDRLFNKAIANTRRKLDLIFGRGLSDKGISTEFSEETVAKILNKQSTEIAKLRNRIVTLQRWQHDAHPFLVKAVALSESSGGVFGFSAQMLHDALIINHESSGREATSMKNVPVMVFLPQKPARVYHTIGMKPGPPQILDESTEATVKSW